MVSNLFIPLLSVSRLGMHTNAQRQLGLVNAHPSLPSALTSQFQRDDRHRNRIEVHPGLSDKPSRLLIYTQLSTQAFPKNGVSSVGIDSPLKYTSYQPPTQSIINVCLCLTLQQAEAPATRHDTQCLRRPRHWSSCHTCVKRTDQFRYAKLAMHLACTA